MEATTIIKKPLITEKNTIANEENRYVFEVDRRARKPQIKRAVEELYKVRVVGVSTLCQKLPTRRTRYGYVHTAPVKKAVVKIHADDRIELF